MTKIPLDKGNRMKDGNQPNGMFVGDFLRQHCDFSNEIFNYVTNLSNPTMEQVVSYLKSIGFIHLKDDYWVHDKHLKVGVYIFQATGQLTLTFRGHDADSALDLKRRYSFCRELAEYSKHMPLSTY